MVLLPITKEREAFQTPRTDTSLWSGFSGPEADSPQQYVTPVHSGRPLGEPVQNIVLVGCLNMRASPPTSRVTPLISQHAGVANALVAWQDVPLLLDSTQLQSETRGRLKIEELSRKVASTVLASLEKQYLAVFRPRTESQLQKPTIQSMRPNTQQRPIIQTLPDPRVNDFGQMIRTPAIHGTVFQRSVFHYLGPGAPPLEGGLWIFDNTYRSFVKINLNYVIQVMSPNTTFIFDCSGAGSLIPEFQKVRDQVQAQPDDQDSMFLPHTIPVALFACSGTENLPTNADYPADVLTSCLMSPLRMAFLRHLRMSPLTRTNEKLRRRLTFEGTTVLASDEHVTLETDSAHESNRAEPLGELRWILTSILDAIAWSACTPAQFRALFRRDRHLANIMRNFILAVRILSELGVTPCSFPELPLNKFWNSPLWKTWDTLLDNFFGRLSQLEDMHQVRLVLYKGTSYFQQAPSHMSAFSPQSHSSGFQSPNQSSTTSPFITGVFWPASPDTQQLRMLSKHSSKVGDIASRVTSRMLGDTEVVGLPLQSLLNKTLSFMSNNPRCDQGLGFHMSAPDIIVQWIKDCCENAGAQESRHCPNLPPGPLADELSSRVTKAAASLFANSLRFFPFFREQLHAAECWLMAPYRVSIPQQLSICLQSTVADSLQLRGACALARFIDLGNWYTDKALQDNILLFFFQAYSKLQALRQSRPASFAHLFVFILAKCITVSPSAVIERLYSQKSGQTAPPTLHLIVSLAVGVSTPPDRRFLALVILAQLTRVERCRKFLVGQRLIDATLPLFDSPHPQIRLWAALLVSNLFRAAPSDFVMAYHSPTNALLAVTSTFPSRIANLLNDTSPTVRAAAVDIYSALLTNRLIESLYLLASQIKNNEQDEQAHLQNPVQMISIMSQPLAPALICLQLLKRTLLLTGDVSPFVRRSLLSLLARVAIAWPELTVHVLEQSLVNMPPISPPPRSPVTPTVIGLPSLPLVPLQANTTNQQQYERVRAKIMSLNLTQQSPLPVLSIFPEECQSPAQDGTPVPLPTNDEYEGMSLAIDALRTLARDPNIHISHRASVLMWLLSQIGWASLVCRAKDDRDVVNECGLSRSFVADLERISGVFIQDQNQPNQTQAATKAQKSSGPVPPPVVHDLTEGEVMRAMKFYSLQMATSLCDFAKKYCNSPVMSICVGCATQPLLPSTNVALATHAAQASHNVSAVCVKHGVSRSLGLPPYHLSVPTADEVQGPVTSQGSLATEFARSFHIHQNELTTNARSLLMTPLSLPPGTAQYLGYPGCPICSMVANNFLQPTSLAANSFTCDAFQVRSNLTSNDAISEPQMEVRSRQLWRAAITDAVGMDAGTSQSVSGALASMVASLLPRRQTIDGASVLGSNLGSSWLSALRGDQGAATYIADQIMESIYTNYKRISREVREFSRSALPPPSCFDDDDDVSSVLRFVTSSVYSRIKNTTALNRLGLTQIPQPTVQSGILCDNVNSLSAFLRPNYFTFDSAAMSPRAFSDSSQYPTPVMPPLSYRALHSIIYELNDDIVMPVSLPQLSKRENPDSDELLVVCAKEYQLWEEYSSEPPVDLHQRRLYEPRSFSYQHHQQMGGSLLQSSSHSMTSGDAHNELFQPSEVLSLVEMPLAIFQPPDTMRHGRLSDLVRFMDTDFSSEETDMDDSLVTPRSVSLLAPQSPSIGVQSGLSRAPSMMFGLTDAVGVEPEIIMSRHVNTSTARQELDPVRSVVPSFPTQCHQLESAILHENVSRTLISLLEKDKKLGDLTTHCATCSLNDAYTYLQQQCQTLRIGNPVPVPNSSAAFHSNDSGCNWFSDFPLLHNIAPADASSEVVAQTFHISRDLLAVSNEAGYMSLWESKNANLISLCSLPRISADRCDSTPHWITRGLHFAGEGSALPVLLAVCSDGCIRAVGDLEREPRLVSSWRSVPALYPLPPLNELFSGMKTQTNNNLRPILQFINFGHGNSDGLLQSVTGVQQLPFFPSNHGATYHSCPSAFQSRSQSLFTAFDSSRVDVFDVFNETKLETFDLSQLRGLSDTASAVVRSISVQQGSSPLCAFGTNCGSVVLHDPRCHLRNCAQVIPMPRQAPVDVRLAQINSLMNTYPYLAVAPQGGSVVHIFDIRSTSPRAASDIKVTSPIYGFDFHNCGLLAVASGQSLSYHVPSSRGSTSVQRLPIPAAQNPCPSSVCFHPNELAVSLAADRGSALIYSNSQ